MNKWYLSLGFSETQWPYVRFWLFAVIVSEIILLSANKRLFEAYLFIGSLFLIGLLLRVVGLYPGQWEPIILDFSAVLIAVCFAFLGRLFLDSSFRFILVLCTSLIIVPHLIFIAFRK